MRNILEFLLIAILFISIISVFACLYTLMWTSVPETFTLCLRVLGTSILTVLVSIGILNTFFD